MEGGYMPKKKKERKNIWEDYEPDWKDLQVQEELEAQWKKDHPNWTDEDAAEYYGQIQSDIKRGK